MCGVVGGRMVEENGEEGPMRRRSAAWYVVPIAKTQLSLACLRVRLLRRPIDLRPDRAACAKTLGLSFSAAVTGVVHNVAVLAVKDVGSDLRIAILSKNTNVDQCNLCLLAVSCVDGSVTHVFNSVTCYLLLSRCYNNQRPHKQYHAPTDMRHPSNADR